MEQQLTYPTTTEDPELIPISKIEFTTSMLESLKNYMSADSEPINFLTSDDNTVGKMNRMDQMIKAFKENVKLQPVQLKPHFTVVFPKKPKGATSKEDRIKYYNMKPTTHVSSYSVVDGRHRVVTSVLFNYSRVPAELVM